MERESHLALAMVAIEIPVDPTVPSNMREPVWGCNSPCRSASSITEQKVDVLFRHAIEDNHSTVHTSQCDAVLDAPTGVKKLCALVSNRMCGCVKYDTLTSAFPSISTPNASLSELIRTSGVFPIIEIDKRDRPKPSRGWMGRRLTDQPRDAREDLVAPQLNGP